MKLERRCMDVVTTSNCHAAAGITTTAFAITSVNGNTFILNLKVIRDSEAGMLGAHWEKVTCILDIYVCFGLT